MGILVLLAVLALLYCSIVYQICFSFSASSEESKKRCTSIAELYGSLSCCALPTQPSVAAARGIVNHLSTSSVSQPTLYTVVVMDTLCQEYTYS